MTQIQGLYAMAIGAIVILGVWVLSVASSAPMDRFFTKHLRVAEFFNWFDGSEPMNTKKVPVEATTETKNQETNIFSTRISRINEFRKVK